MRGTGPVLLKIQLRIFVFQESLYLKVLLVRKYYYYIHNHGSKGSQQINSVIRQLNSFFSKKEFLGWRLWRGLSHRGRASLRYHQGRTHSNAALFVVTL